MEHFPSQYLEAWAGGILPTGQTHCSGELPVWWRGWKRLPELTLPAISSSLATHPNTWIARGWMTTSPPKDDTDFLCGLQNAQL